MSTSGTVPQRSSSNSTPIESSFNEDKYKKLKRKLRDIIKTNDAMLKQYGQTRKKIKTLTYERNLLLDNIARMEHMVSSDENSSDLLSDISDSGNDSVVDGDVKDSVKTMIKKQPEARRRRAKKEISQHSGQDKTTVASAPPKRSKMSKVQAKTRRVQPIERDESGNPKLPQQIGVLTVLKLGTIEPHREAFHNERYIFPIGYTVSRTYPSMVDPANNTVITSTIVDGGDGPRFHVEAADQEGQPIIANSATGAWTVVVRKTNEIRHRDHSNSASGPDYYGFKHPTIAKMIQDLPGAKELQHYVWQPFEEMEPRAAKGVMAAAVKKRGNLEQMGNANTKGAKAKAARMARAGAEDGAPLKVATAMTTNGDEGDGNIPVTFEMDSDTTDITPRENDARDDIRANTLGNETEDDDDNDDGSDMNLEDDEEIRQVRFGSNGNYGQPNAAVGTGWHQSTYPLGIESNENIDELNSID
ncbi:F/Y rich C-terminus-domain-containing protein [Absidia repens]|uniref:F/Y rich C-terminus-domain-containing protein n=1 Tax=Absidia repens TaxID=90262 RepID=A0A1X2IYK2_9FUNG|nr:F/Y rich C-terminus-domain-containing protein [Absidia repens]